MDLHLLADAANTQIAPGLEEARLLGIKLINVEDFLKLLLRFTLNTVVTHVIVRSLYFKSAKKPEFVFTYYLISATVFLLCVLLESVKLELGFALGLFAVFGIIRYRTDPIPIKEMTYLFVVIGVAVVNSLSNKKVSYAELLFTNLAVVLFVLALESKWVPRHERSQLVIYENIELIVPEHREQMLSDLRARTGLDVKRVEIGTLNFLRDTAEVTIYFLPEEHPDYRPPTGAVRFTPGSLDARTNEPDA